MLVPTYVYLLLSGLLLLRLKGTHSPLALPATSEARSLPPATACNLQSRQPQPSAQGTLKGFINPIVRHGWCYGCCQNWFSDPLPGAEGT
jgi:hypothetical protein